MEHLTYKNKFDDWVEKSFIFLLTIAPLFVITIPKWMNTLLFICAAFSIYLIFKIKGSGLINKEFINEPNLSKWLWLLILTFTGPFVATFISQLFKNHWIIAEFDSPLRFLLAIPILLTLVYRQINISDRWTLIIPLTMVVTLVLIPILPKTGWGNDPSRLTTSFVDPLTFGRICLTFGLISLFTIHLNKSKWYVSGFQMLGCLVGIYLSIRSGSRTGWLALGPVLIFFITTISEKHRWRNFILACIVTCITLFSIYQFSNTVRDRVNLAVHEVATYKFDELNPDNSVGMRISFARMGWYYFGLAPFSGLTQEQLLLHRDDAEISKYATEFTRQFPINAMFHNEFTTNAVRHGIWGIISTSFLFFVPLALFIFAAIRLKSSRIPLLGIAYIMCEFISGMSTEVFSLKFIAALYAIVMAGLCGSVLNLLLSQPNQESSHGSN